ncbi:hypothetical protein PR048_009143 [Dryococelus australis]|uniref:DUF4817 domain-containing protein n=1 Tax=Dryococelus australis TaxID=614101 RepID=A0ABQ9I0X7_9NEOP|nr:hypothetical protein PR048_009143 [Dryococelus australis]
MEYTIEEYCDKYRTLGECRDNANAAAWLYRERYRGCRHPTANVIRRLDQWARESGLIIPGQGVIRRRQLYYRHTSQVEDRVRNPTLSLFLDGAWV